MFTTFNNYINTPCPSKCNIIENKLENQKKIDKQVRQSSSLALLKKNHLT